MAKTKTRQELSSVENRSERKSAHHGRHEQRYRFLCSQMPVPCHSIDASGRIVDVSGDWLNMLGYERNEVVGRRSVDFLSDESRRYAETTTLPEFWKKGHARNVGYQFVKKNGESVDVLLSAVAKRGEDGHFARTIAILTDVTQRKRLEEELQREREELEGKVERQMVRRNPYGLTFREFTVLHHVATGKADKEIARELGISPLTVHKHLANILAKMNAGSRTEATARALREGLLD